MAEFTVHRSQNQICSFQPRISIGGGLDEIVMASPVQPHADLQQQQHHVRKIRRANWVRFLRVRDSASDANLACCVNKCVTGGGIAYVATRDIAVGEELSVAYEKSIVESDNDVASPLSLSGNEKDG